MEWQGIDLSFSRQFYWLKETKRNIIKMMMSIIILVLFAVIMLMVYHKSYEVYQLNVEQSQEYQNKIERIESKINHLKQAVRKEELNAIENKFVERFLLYIEQFEVSGAIDSIQLYRNDKVFLKIIGKLHHQSEFQRIEKQLKESKLDYQIEQYQTNDKQQVEFTLLIKFGA